MLKRNGIEAALAPRYPDRAAREAEIRRQARFFQTSFESRN